MPRKQAENGVAREDRGVAHEDNDAAHRNPDQMFARDAAAGNQFEIQAAQYVEQAARNPQVKELARQMVQDHTQSLQQLEQIAQPRKCNSQRN